MFPDKVNMMYEKWPQLTPKVLDLVGKTVKDKTVLKLLSLADNDADIGKLLIDTAILRWNIEDIGFMDCLSACLCFSRAHSWISGRGREAKTGILLLQCFDVRYEDWGQSHAFCFVNLGCYRN